MPSCRLERNIRADEEFAARVAERNELLPSAMP